MQNKSFSTLNGLYSQNPQTLKPYSYRTKVILKVVINDWLINPFAKNSIDTS